MICLFLHEQDAVLFGAQDLQCVGIKSRRNQHFEKDLIDCRCRGLVDGPVASQYTAKSAFRVAGQRAIPGLFYGGTDGDAAGICMFDNREDGLIMGEFADQLYSCVDIHEVIVG